MLAQMVDHLGVALGERLYGATVNNKHGHYEDQDFMEFHMQLLEGCCGHNWLVDHAPPFGEVDVKQAQAIIANRQHLPLWGWKDPRTTLFLNDWESLLEAPLYIFIWRRCAEVMSSAARRSRRELSPVTAFQKADGGLRNRLFQARKVNSYTQRYAASWLFYNRRLLEFMQAKSERCLLFYLNDLISQPNLLLEPLEGALGLVAAGRCRPRAAG